MTALTLHCLDCDGKFVPTPDDLARLVAFLTDDAVIDALNERQADDRQAVDEAPYEDGFSWPGYEYQKPNRPRFVVSKSWAERWTGNPEHIKAHYPGFDWDVEVK
jgi:hypothetical protein